LLTPVGLRPHSVSKTDLHFLQLFRFLGLTSLTNVQIFGMCIKICLDFVAKL